MPPISGIEDSPLQELSSIQDRVPQGDVFIGTKIVRGRPMYHEDFLRQKGKWQEGQESMGDGYLVVYEDGYESWSPKDVFERCYRKITNAELSLID